MGWRRTARAKKGLGGVEAFKFWETGGFGFFRVLGFRVQVSYHNWGLVEEFNLSYHNRDLW